MIIIILIVIVLSHHLLSNKTFAISPSFARQEIKNGLNAWSLLPPPNSNPEIFTTHTGTGFIFKPASNISQCKEIRYGLPPPDIGSVSYLSDGKTLDATAWLTRPISLPITNEFNIMQPFLRIDAFKIKNITLNEFAYNEINLLRQNHFNVSTFSPTKLENNPAYKIMFSYNGGKNEPCKLCKATETLTEKGGISYTMIYVADATKYSSVLPIVQTMINSTKIGTTSSILGIHRISNFLTYENSTLGLRTQYPYNWIKVSILKGHSFFGIHNIGQIGGVMFRFPSGPYSLYKEFIMFININSIYNLNTSGYKVRISWDAYNQSWTKSIEEISSIGQKRILYKNGSYIDFLQKGETYIPMNFDLGIAGFPDQYTATISTIDQFVNNGKLCTLTDNTTPITIPPPQYHISISPNNLKLEPGTEKDVQLLIKSGTNLASHVTIPSNVVYNIKVNSIPKETDIPPAENTNVDLHVDVPNNASSEFQLTIPVNAKISFPPIVSQELLKSHISIYGGPKLGAIKVDYSSSPVLIRNSNVTVLVHALTPEERLNNFYSAWISPLNGVWTLLAAIAAVIVPLVVRLYTKRENENKNKNKRIDEWSDQH